MAASSISASPDFAIEADGLVKVFGDNRAVDGVDLRVAAGTVYGVLGPNGAGKTTTINMLTTLMRPDGGSARVAGHDIAKEPNKVRARVSLAGQYASVDEDLTGRENLLLLSRLFGFSRSQARTRTSDLLAAFGLEEAGNRQVKNYSGGMRRRIDIAASLMVVPDVMFLDEPTTGLDPRSRNQVWEIIRQLAAAGTTVLLTTQYLEEADQLAERIAVIDHGKVIAEGTSGELKASIGSGVLTVRLMDSGQRQQARDVLSRELNEDIELTGDPFEVLARISDAEAANRAIAALAPAGIAVAEFALGQASLDEVFLALTGHPADAGVSSDTPATGERTGK